MFTHWLCMSLFSSDVFFTNFKKFIKALTSITTSHKMQQNLLSITLHTSCWSARLVMGSIR